MTACDSCGRACACVYVMTYERTKLVPGGDVALGSCCYSAPAVARLVDVKATQQKTKERK